LLGTWSVTSDQNEILSRLSAALEPNEAIHA
jgi:hypothetical protein